MKELKKRIMQVRVICLISACALIVYLFWIVLSAQPAEESRKPNRAETEAAISIPEQPQNTEPPVETAAQWQLLTVTAARNADGVQHFLLTLEDFIEQYNRLYKTDYGKPWLTPAGEWYPFARAAAPCTGTAATRYEFDSDKNTHNDPDFWVYVPEGDDNICEISLGMPEHDWTQWRYQTFREQCYYTLSAVYPELNVEDIWSLFDLLYADAMENELISQSAKPEPKILRYINCVGCYGFIQSGVIRINIIPVDSQFLEVYAQKGGVTYGI